MQHIDQQRLPTGLSDKFTAMWTFEDIVPASDEEHRHISQRIKKKRRLTVALDMMLWDEECLILDRLFLKKCAFYHVIALEIRSFCTKNTVRSLRNQFGCRDFHFNLIKDKPQDPENMQ
jgi:hypothetical protein